MTKSPQCCAKVGRARTTQIPDLVPNFLLERHMSQSRAYLSQIIYSRLEQLFSIGRVSTVKLKKKDIIFILPILRFVGVKVFIFGIRFVESVR